jgi:hypothetical protein
MFHISIPFYHPVFTDISNIYLSHRCFIYLYRFFISIYRCFKYISQTPMFQISIRMFHTVFTVSFKYIFQKQMFHISIPMFHPVFTDISNIYISHRCFIYLYRFFISIYRCFKYISQTRMFQISIRMFHTVFTDVLNIYFKNRCFIYLYRCFIQYLPIFQKYISLTDVSYIYTDFSYSVYRCFKYISQTLIFV